MRSRIAEAGVLIAIASCRTSPVAPKPPLEPSVPAPGPTSNAADDWLAKSVGSTTCEALSSTTFQHAQHAPEGRAECETLLDGWRRDCNESSVDYHPEFKPPCIMRVFALTDKPACQAEAAKVLCSEQLPRGRCREGAPITTSPSMRLGATDGNVQLIVRSEVTTIPALPAGILGIAIDGKGVLVTKIGAAPSFGTFWGRLDPGLHTVELFTRLWPDGTFSGAGVMSEKCFNVSADRRVIVTALFANAPGPPEIVGPLSIKLVVEQD